MNAIYNPRWTSATFPWRDNLLVIWLQASAGTVGTSSISINVTFCKCCKVRQKLLKSDWNFWYITSQELPQTMTVLILNENWDILPYYTISKKTRSRSYQVDEIISLACCNPRHGGSSQVLNWKLIKYTKLTWSCSKLGYSNLTHNQLKTNHDRRKNSDPHYTGLKLILI